MANTAGNSLSIFSLLDALRRRKFIVIIPTMLLTVGFTIYAKYQPNRYRTTAIIAAEQTTPPEYLKHVAPPALNIEEHLWTVRQVIFSDPVLKVAAKETKKYRDVQGELSPQQLEEFREQVNTSELIKIDSEHTFKLTYESGDRYEAMNVTNKLAEAFVQHASAKREKKTEEAATVIDDQFEALKKRMDDQSKQIHDYKTKTVNALPDHIDDNIRGVQSTKEQIQDRDTKISEEQAKRASIERELQDLEAKGVLDQPIVHEKTADETKVEELRIQLAELQTRYTAAHPSVTNMKRQISDLERSIASQPKKGRNEPSPTYLRYSQLKSELEGVDQRIAGYRRDQQKLQAQMDTYSHRLEATPQHEKVIEDMNRELRVGELQFHALLDKKLDNNLAKGFEQSQSGIAFAVTEPAGLPQAPYSPQRERLILMGIVAGLGLGLILAFVLEQNDTTFGTVDDFQTFTTLPVAGVLPNIQPGKKKGKAANPIVTIDDPESIAAEQYRILAMKVQQQCDAAAARTILITSAAGGEGKSLTAINLATALAATTDGRVALVDADMRKPRIGEYLKLSVSPDRGFHNLLVNADAKPENYVQKLKNVYIIPGGVASANPVAALSSPKARALFDKLKQEFAYIVVDAPPVLPIADSHILAGLADKVLFVVRARQTPRELFQHAIEGFEAANLLGAVLNDVDYQRSRYAYAYEYYKKTA
jgi:polysaccharide chain length determinant protein (PEP-CTERM system associated)